MASGGYRLFAACVVIFLVLAEPGANAAVPCGVALKAVGPCISYVTGRVPKPTHLCCRGLRSLNSSVKTKADRQGVCACLKDYGSEIRGLVGSRVTAFPGACGVEVPYPVTQSIDCKAIP